MTEDLRSYIHALLVDSKEKRQAIHYATKLVELLYPRYKQFAKEVYAEICARAWNERMKSEKLDNESVRQREKLS